MNFRLRQLTAMKKDLELWHFASERLDAGETLVLLIVVESRGSSPGRRGFKMIAAADGLCGSIGGGLMEIEMVDRARRVLQDIERSTRQGEEPGSSDHRSALDELNAGVRLVHRKESPDSSGMICSGEQTVIGILLRPGQAAAVREIIACIGDPGSGILEVRAAGLRVLKDAGGDAASRSRQIGTDAGGDEDVLFAERIGTADRLFIVGGGHCALALSELMSRLDFHISLFDDRSDLNTIEKNEFADRKTIIDSYLDIGPLIPSGRNNYVVVMTLGYKFDEIVIRQLFDKDFKYFGVLGSRAKMRTLLRELEDDGFDRERLDRIRTPIGLPIKSRTPEEIAVSIAAEIISVRNR